MYLSICGRGMRPPRVWSSCTVHSILRFTTRLGTKERYLRRVSHTTIGSRPLGVRLLRLPHISRLLLERPRTQERIFLTVSPKPGAPASESVFYSDLDGCFVFTFSLLLCSPRVMPPSLTSGWAARVSNASMYRAAGTPIRVRCRSGMTKHHAFRCF